MQKLKEKVTIHKHSTLVGKSVSYGGMGQQFYTILHVWWGLT